MRLIKHGIDAPTLHVGKKRLKAEESGVVLALDPRSVRRRRDMTADLFIMEAHRRSVGSTPKATEDYSRLPKLGDSFVRHRL